MKPCTISAQYQSPPDVAHRIDLWLGGHYELLRTTVPLWVWEMVWAFGTERNAARVADVGVITVPDTPPPLVPPPITPHGIAALVQRLTPEPPSRTAPAPMQAHDRQALGDFLADDIPVCHWRATPGCPPQQAMDPQGIPPPVRPRPRMPRPPSLRDTARLLASRDLSWWTTAATGTVGAITFRTQAVHDAGQSRNLHVRVLTGLISRDAPQTGRASQPSAIIVADADSLPDTVLPDNNTYVCCHLR